MSRSTLEITNHGMAQAVLAARRWLGATTPNPPVGAAALDADGVVLAVAAHEKAGQPHAEAALLAKLRESGLLEKTHTLCVTLEPCNHHGRTPPCTEAIISSGIKHVAIGTADPNPKVAGGGSACLQAAGIAVTENILQPQCQQLIAAFAHAVSTGRPWITVKRALDTNGSMIPPPGQKTFTSPASLKLAHQLRKRADVIMTGSGTVLADYAEFTVRHIPDYPGKERWLAVLDRRRRVPQGYYTAAEERGFIPLPCHDWLETLDYLGEQGQREILLEAGPKLTQAVLESDLWCMKVTIQAFEAADQITVEYNPLYLPPAITANWQWQDMLPLEE